MSLKKSAYLKQFNIINTSSSLGSKSIITLTLKSKIDEIDIIHLKYLKRYNKSALATILVEGILNQ